MKRPNTRLAIALATLAVWIAITVLGAGVGHPGHRSLEDLASTGIAWQVVAAALVLVGVIAWQRWRDLGFRAPDPGTLHLLWFPAALLLLLLVCALMFGLPPAGVMLIVLTNSLLVGVSEEVMFRGILYRALRDRLAIWPAIGWTTGAFGGVHILNGFVTGAFGPAALQAILAACSGLLLIAIFLRTGSLWVAILFHGLWDGLLFLMVLGAKDMTDTTATEATEAATSGSLLPLLLILPNLLYGIWLLLGINRDTPPGDRQPA